MVAPSSFGILTLLLSGILGSGASFMGLPPGERDPAFLKAAPSDSLAYLEWSTRGKGVEGGEGIDGLAADPEVRLFLSQLRTAIFAMIERQAANANSTQEKLLAEHAPVFVEKLLHRSGCLFLSYSPPQRLQDPNLDAPGDPIMGLAANVNLTLILNLGDEADELEQRLIKLMLPVVEDFGMDLPGNHFDRYQLPIPIPSLKAEIHREANYLILGLGQDSIPRAVQGIKGEVAGLGSSDSFLKHYERVEMDRVGGLVWLDLARVRTIAFEMLPAPITAVAQSIMQSLSVDAVDGAISTMGVIDGQIATKTYIQTGPKQSGLLSFVAGAPLTPQNYAHVPADSDFVMSFSLNAEAIITAIESVVEGVDPSLSENLSGTKGMLAEQLGFSLHADLPQAFGQHWTVFDSVASGGVLLTSMTVAVEVKDAEKAKRIHETLMQLLNGALPGVRAGEYRTRGVELKRQSFQDHEIDYVNTVGDDAPLAPSFCLTERHLLFALHPQAIKAQLRFLQSGAPSLAKSLEGQLPDGGSMIAYSEFDAPQLLRYLYSIVPYVAQVGLSEVQGKGFAMDIFAIPSARGILPYLKKSRGWVVRTNEGILLESRSSLPISPVLGILPVFGIRSASPYPFDDQNPAFQLKEVPRDEFGFVPPPVLTP